MSERSEEGRSGEGELQEEQTQNLLDEDGGEVLPGNYPMIHQFHEGRQCVRHDHVVPE